MKRRIVFFNLAALAVLLPALAFALRPGPLQEDKPVEERLAQLEEDLFQLQERLATLERETAALNEFRKDLIQGAGKLDQAVEKSRELGFESAGPNPLSKTELLMGLKTFAADVQGIPSGRDEGSKER